MIFAVFMTLEEMKLEFNGLGGMECVSRQLGKLGKRDGKEIFYIEATEKEIE